MRYLLIIILLLATLTAHAASLDFDTGAANEYVDFGSNFALESGFTFWAWVRPDTTGANRGFIGEQRAGAGLGKLLFTTDPYRLRGFMVSISGSNPDAQSTNLTLSTGTWSWAAYTFDGSNPVTTTSHKLFHASQTSTAPQEVTYASRNGGVTAATTTTDVVLVGARTTGGTDALDGRIAFAGVHSRALSIFEMAIIFRCPRLAALPIFSPLLVTSLGLNGTKAQRNLAGSGRNGAPASGVAYSPQTPPIWGFCMI